MNQEVTTLRPATATDLPQIIALDQAIFGAYGADEDPAIIQARLAVFPQGCLVWKLAQPPTRQPSLGI
jgi:hypothetical protein